jgi:cyanophycinase
LSVKKGRTVGRLLVIGGAEDPNEDEMHILPHLVKLAGGNQARIFICSSPSENPEEKVRTYGKLFQKLGAQEIYDGAIRTRPEADEEKHLAAIEKATAIFFTGGDQLRLTSVIAGTKLGKCVEERLFREGLVVAGTSAGAAAMSGTMIIGGANDGTVRRSDVELAPGFGYWRDTVVDTHFNQRGRAHRLVTVFAHNPQVLGVGIDEDTAIEVVPGKHFTVIGSGAVMIFDGRVTHTNAADRSFSQTLALTDSMLHVLADGYGFNLVTKRPILPNGVEIPLEDIAVV